MKPLPNADRTTPLSRLIEARIKALGLTETEFLRGIGYRDLSKGRRRLLQFREAEGLRGLNHHERQLAEVLEVEPTTIQQAIARTYETARKWEFEEYSANFYPHAILKTARTIPSQITFCGLTGGPERWLKVKFPDGSRANEYVSYVLKDLPDIVPFFGKVNGFWINYTVSNCVEYDKSGRVIAEFDAPKRLGVTSISI